LILTSAAVALGVAVLLSVVAEFHAFQVTSKRPSWESTGAMSGSGTSNRNVELWNYSESLYNGQFIEILRVAPLGPNAPVVPGIPHLPSAGERYVSPALARLLATVPNDELGARFPGRQAGVIGQAALTGPQELVAIVGQSPSSLARLPDTIRVDRIQTAPQSQGTTNIYRVAFGIGAIAVLFPLLILIATATRLSAARREERYAAIRLVGGTPRQINALASIDAVAGALLGTFLGIVLFLLLRPALDHLSFSGARFFPQYVTPTLLGYVALILVVPVAAVAASLLSLRRVQVSPLGVARRTTPKPPGPWRLALLVIGVVVFLVPVIANAGHPQKLQGGPIWLGLLLIMAGLIMSGPWLTMQGSRALAHWARGATSLLAGRRLADNPRGAFRSVSGLVLAVFLGTAIAVLAPAVNAAQSPQSDASVGQLLRMQYFPQLSAAQGNSLLGAVKAVPGATALPIYSNPQFPKNGPPSGPAASYDSVMECSSFASLSTLGTCSPGASTRLVNAQNLFTDNPIFVYKALPLAGPHNPAGPSTVSGLGLNGLLVETNNASTLERVRTVMTQFDSTLPLIKDSGAIGPGGLTAWQMGAIEPETFAEVAQIRNNDDNNVQRVVLTILGLTLLVAGCSLAVAVGGSLVERKRPFTLMRASGTPESSLRRVVLAEAIIPLVTAAVVAGVVAIAVARPFVEALVPRYAHVAYPGPTYYLTMAVGLLFAVAVIFCTLPLLGRITRPEEVRFE
jgi:hypothetical protein